MPHQDEFQPTEQRTLTRNKMIEATITLLAREGYARTSWRRVAEEAGVTGGVLQYHFGDKLTLVSAVIEYLCDEHAESLRQTTFIEGATLRKRVESFVAAAFELMSGPREVALLELLIGTRANEGRAVSAVALAAMKRTHDELWRELFQDVDIPRERLVAVEHLLFAAIHGFAVQRLFDPQRRPDLTLAALVDAIAGLLEAPDSAGPGFGQPNDE